MISPYDDQLIGKMNFRYSGIEHAMFFTYARSSEYPGMKFRNHKIIYLSLDVNEISSELFMKLCTRFGGYIIHNDDLEVGWEKIERQQTDSDDDLSLSDEIVAERQFMFETEEEGQEKKVYRELKLEPDVEEEAEEREWAAPVQEMKEPKQDKRPTNSRNRNNRGNKVEKTETQQERKEPSNKTEQTNNKEQRQKEAPKDTLKNQQKDGLKEMHKEAQKSTAKNAGKQTPKESAKISVNLNGSDGNKEKAKITVNLQPREYGTDATKDHNADKDSAKNGQKPHHRRGHRGGRKHANKSQKDGLAQKTQQPKTDA